MSNPGSAARRARFAGVAAVTVTLLLAACATPPNKEDEEAAKSTFACKLSGERLIVRIDIDEVRLLMPDGDRIILYQIPAASGVRYSNGNFELHGKGMDLQLVRNGSVTPLLECQPYQIPK